MVASAGFSFSFSAEAPPDVPAVPGAPAFDDASLLSLGVVSPLVEELSLALVVFADVVEVDVVCAAATSALVFVGGVMSGVLLGTASETLVPPQAPSVNPHSNTAHAASAARALTTVPCAGRTWGSR